MRPGITETSQTNIDEANQPENNVQMTDLELCRELAKRFDENVNDYRISNRKTRGIVNASTSAAFFGSTALLLTTTFLTAGILAPITLPAAFVTTSLGVRGLRETIRPELMEKRLAYMATLKEVIGENPSVAMMLIPGTESSRAKENLKLLVKIGKGEENEEKITKIPRVFINTLKTGFAKLKENEVAAEAAVNDRARTTNPLHYVPLKTTQRQSGTSSLNPNPNQESNNGEKKQNNTTPSDELRNPSITSLNRNKNPQDQGR